MGHVLVVHASRHGSTAEVAQRMAQRMRADGHDVDVVAARAAKNPVGGYGLVVVGGALYSGRWHIDAHRFLKRHRGELTDVPVAVFGMGPRRNVTEAWQRSRFQLQAALAKRDWLHPVAVTVFGGVDPKAKRGQARRDIRDWEAIEAWADQLTAPDTQPASPDSSEA